MNKEVKIKDIGLIKVAIIKHKGSFKEINLIYKDMRKWIGDNHFEITRNHSFRFDTKYEDLTVNDIVFELGITVKSRSNNKNLVRMVEIPEHEIISALYKGPYFNLPSVHGFLENYARKNELAPIDFPKEIYLNDPLDVKYDELLTEVQFPVLDYQPEDIFDVPLVDGIERKLVEEQKMAIMEHYGAIEDVYKIRLDLIKWTEKHNIKANAFHFKYNLSPDRISSEMVFEVAVPVDVDVKNEDNIKIVEIPEHEVLSAVYKGPYLNLPNVHRMIVNYAFENNLELVDFPTEIYLNSIFDVGCDELLTEVRIPVTDPKFDKNIQLEKKVERKWVEKNVIAFIRQKGSFERINKIKSNLFNWIEKNNIKTSGHHFLRFRNHPRSLSPENIYYELGMTLDNSVEDSIKVIDFPMRKVLSVIHKGSISSLKDTHDFIESYAKENNFYPLDFPVNVFIDKIPENIEDDVLIDVQLSVVKI